MEKLILLNIAISIFLIIRPMFKKPELIDTDFYEIKKACWVINNPPVFKEGDKVMIGGKKDTQVHIITGHFLDTFWHASTNNKYGRVYTTNTGKNISESILVPYIECGKNK